MNSTGHSVKITEADLSEKSHQDVILELVNMYSMDKMGSGRPLSSYTNENLILGLKNHPTTIVFLAYSADVSVGIAVCFKGFSTFAAKPLINIHDFAVKPGYRKMGIGTAILKAIEEKAKKLGCCKLTLEVQENNTNAQQVYHSFGFNQGTYLKEAGGSLFFTKEIE